MEHLPRPQYGRKPSFIVPLLGGTLINYDSFLTYPLDIDIALCKQNEYTPFIPKSMESLDDFFAGLQNWLYFGLLREFFGDHFELDDFISRPSDAAACIDSANLTRCTRNWVQRSRKLKRSVVAAEVKEKLKMLKLSWKFINHVDLAELTSEHNLAHADRLARHLRFVRVVFSIRILISTLHDMIYSFDEYVHDAKEYFRLPSFVRDWEEIPASYSPLIDQMKNARWCSAEIMRLLRTYSCTTLWYLSYLPDTEVDHLSHEDCRTSSACVARDISAMTYQATHLSPGCDCAAIGPNQEDVKAALRNNQTPLILCEIKPDGSITFKVIATTRPINHFAISHVWADGMGVQNQNTIHSCHFESLIAMARQAYIEDLVKILGAGRSFGVRRIAEALGARKTSFLMWIDIFCIPDGLDLEVSTLKKTGITQIDMIFAAAELVLIVDRGLTRADCAAESTLDSLARFTISGWMTRSWTLLEASLANPDSTYICTNARLFNLLKILERLHSEEQDSRKDLFSQWIERDLVAALAPFVVAWVPTTKEQEPPTREYLRFCLIWNALSSRAISRNEDIYYIVAMMMGFDMSDLMKCPEEDRLAALLQDLNIIPRGFLCKDIPRRTSGPIEQRWIPLQVGTTVQYLDTFDFSDEGIVIGDNVPFKFVLDTASNLPRKFVIGTPSLSSRHAGERTYYTITLHRPPPPSDSVQTTNQSFCFVLNLALTQERADRNWSVFMGEGTCLMLKGDSTQSVRRGDFLTSLTYMYMTSDEKATRIVPNVFDVEILNPQVIVSCDRSLWPRLRRLNRYRHIRSHKIFSAVCVAFFVCLVAVLTLASIHPYVWSSYLRRITAVGCGLHALYVFLYLGLGKIHRKMWIDSFASRDMRSGSRWWIDWLGSIF